MDSFWLKTYMKHSRNFYYKNPENYNKILNNEIQEFNLDPPKKGKYIYITFADSLNTQHGKERITNAKKLQSYINDNNKFIDEFIVYNLEDIDYNFKMENINVLKNKRYFAWISKVYFINKKLKELDVNDVLLWTDSDVKTLYENGTLQLFNLCNNSEKGIVGFHHNFWLEKYFTKRTLFEYLNVKHESYYETQQIYGGILLLKKNQFTINIIEEWLNICLKPSLFCDNTENNQHKEFIEHKHCQSIFSLLLKKNNIKTFPLPLSGISTNNDIIAIHSGYNNYPKPIVWAKSWHNSLERLFFDSKGKLKWNATHNKHQPIILPENSLYISIKKLKEVLFPQESTNQTTYIPPTGVENTYQFSSHLWQSPAQALDKRRRQAAAYKRHQKRLREVEHAKARRTSGSTADQINKQPSSESLQTLHQQKRANAANRRKLKRLREAQRAKEEQAKVEQAKAEQAKAEQAKAERAKAEPVNEQSSSESPKIILKNIWRSAAITSHPSTTTTTQMPSMAMDENGALLQRRINAVEAELLRLKELQRQHNLSIGLKTQA